MTQVSAAEILTGVVIGFHDRLRIVLKALILQIQHPIRSKHRGMPRETGRHHTVEHIHAKADHLQQLRRRAHAHHIAWLLLRHHRCSCRNLPNHLFFWLSDADAANRIARKIHLCQFTTTMLTQVIINRALNNTEDMMPRFEKTIFGRML